MGKMNLQIVLEIEQVWTIEKYEYTLIQLAWNTARYDLLLSS